MPRLFVGNFEFEHFLANERYQASAKIRRLNAELAASWLAVAEEGDFLWCPESIPWDFFNQAQLFGLPPVIPVTDLAQVPAAVELVPWGWTSHWTQSARKNRWSCSAPDPAVVRDVNSRQFSFDLEAEWHVGLPAAAAICDFLQLDAALSQAAAISSCAVIKANRGMSARERILVSRMPTDSDRSWVRRRLHEQGAVFVEPWVAREEEIGIQIQIPRQGPPQLVGISALICNSVGQYSGSWFTDPPDAGAGFHRRWQPAVEMALHAAERMRQRGYFGPVGIDALRYRREDGGEGMRPLQDINARWTMGRLSLGWRKLLRPTQIGFWQHGPYEPQGQHPPRGSNNPCQIIDTSPIQIGDRLVEHGSRLLIFDS